MVKLLRVPPLLVGVLCGGAMWCLALLAPLPNLPGSVHVAVAGALAVAGLGVMLAGVFSFRRARTTVNPLKPETTTSLVVNGVYRFTRNPMYLGMLLLLLAWAAYLSSPFSLVGAAAFWFCMDRYQIRPEEQALKTLFGAGFSNYMLRVRRWL